MIIPDQSHVNRIREALWQRPEGCASVMIGAGFSSQRETGWAETHDNFLSGGILRRCYVLGSTLSATATTLSAPWRRRQVRVVFFVLLRNTRPHLVGVLCTVSFRNWSRMMIISPTTFMSVSYAFPGGISSRRIGTPFWSEHALLLLIGPTALFGPTTKFHPHRVRASSNCTARFLRTFLSFSPKKTTEPIRNDLPRS